MRRRARGFTLVEVLISLALAAIMSTFLLMLTRGQLSAYAMNDQLTKAQQNGRAGMDFLESTVRKACGGISEGRLVVAGTSIVRYCFQAFDGAVEAGGTFTNGSAANANADAIEVVYGTAPFTVTTAAPTLPVTSVAVGDTRGFNANEFALLTDHKEAMLFQIQSVAPGAAIASGATPGTLTFTAPGSTMPPGWAAMPATVTVMAAQSLSIFMRPANTGNFSNMLLVDPNGMAGTDHLDAEPVVEGAEDFQIAVGIDTNDNGIIDVAPDEWLGNNAGVTEFPLVNTAKWNTPFTTPPSVAPQYRQVRISLLARTTAQYAGLANTPLSIENRTSFPTYAGAPPRYRQMRMIVAPRAWNLLN
jgi:prepilin-type N-terminal cleavage/methylation domain-containing protein